MKTKPKPRNPIAQAVKKIPPKIKPNKREYDRMDDELKEAWEEFLNELAEGK